MLFLLTLIDPENFINQITSLLKPYWVELYPDSQISPYSISEYITEIKSQQITTENVSYFLSLVTFLRYFHWKTINFIDYLWLISWIIHYSIGEKVNKSDRRIDQCHYTGRIIKQVKTS